MLLFHSCVIQHIIAPSDCFERLIGYLNKMFSDLYLFPRADITKYYNLSALKATKILLFHHCRHWKLEIKVWAGHVPSETHKGQSFYAFSWG